MAGNKYLKKGTSGFAEEQASIDTSAGAGDAGKIIAANGSGKLDETFLPAGVGADSKTATAGEALSAGDLVYVTGTGTIMKADANTVTKKAIGFVQSAISNAASGTVYFDGTITGLSGLTPGADYFLSAATAGGITATPPSGAGDIVQFVGVALSATELTFNPAPPIIVA